MCIYIYICRIQLIGNYSIDGQMLNVVIKLKINTRIVYSTTRKNWQKMKIKQLLFNSYKVILNRFELENLSLPSVYTAFVNNLKHETNEKTVIEKRIKKSN